MRFIRFLKLKQSNDVSSLIACFFLLRKYYIFDVIIREWLIKVGGTRVMFLCERGCFF